jgi:hypothetical protein
MAQLTNDKSRKYKVSRDVRNELPVAATTTIYAGSAVGDNGAGYVRQLVAGDVFRGFSDAKAANVADPTKPGLTINGVSLGSAGAINCDLREQGVVEVAAIAGAVGVVDVSKTVYMTDGDTFTLSSSNSASKVGTISHYLNGLFGIFFRAATATVT